MEKDKRVFGYFELLFDALYLVAALAIGVIILFRGSTKLHLLSGIMAIVLVAGDSFHLLPRMAAIITQDTDRFRVPLGIGKLVTSITMTVFYLLLWHIGVLLFSPVQGRILTIFVYILAGVRAILCLLPQNRWTAYKPPVFFGILRNIPFALLGTMVAVLFFSYRKNIPSLEYLWLAVTLSFLFYLPVVVWGGQKPMLGMLMLPKTCTYIWILAMFLPL